MVWLRILWFMGYAFVIIQFLTYFGFICCDSLWHLLRNILVNYECVWTARTWRVAKNIWCQLRIVLFRLRKYWSKVYHRLVYFLLHLLVFFLPLIIYLPHWLTQMLLSYRSFVSFLALTNCDRSNIEVCLSNYTCFFLFILQTSTPIFPRIFGHEAAG